MTKDEILTQIQEKNPQHMVAIFIGEDNMVYVNHTDMPAPVLCLMEKILSQRVDTVIQPVPVKRPTVLTALTQKPQ